MKISINYTHKQIQALEAILRHDLDETEPRDIEGKLVYLMILKLQKRLYERVYKMAMYGQAKTAFTYPTELAFALYLWWMIASDKYNRNPSHSLAVTLIQELVSEVHRKSV